ncbi:MAG TPA: hypothetical protein VGY66_06675 [Gemmataceae bacterium]|nr:hypothetical protein [Gemmataceae bacterium]
MQHAHNVLRLRHYACGNKRCDSYGQRFADQPTIDKAPKSRKDKVFCPDCGKPISLRDIIEEEFETRDVKEQTRQLQAEARRRSTMKAGSSSRCITPGSLSPRRVRSIAATPGSDAT